MNPAQATTSCLKGLRHIIARMDWYCSLADHILQKDNIDIGKRDFRFVLQQLEARLVVLYKALLLYQMKSVCFFYRHQGMVFLRGLVNLDNWDAYTTSVTDAEAALQEDLDQFNSQHTKSFLGEFVASAKRREMQLDDIRQTLQNHYAFQKETRKDDEDTRCLRDLQVTNPSEDKMRIEDSKGGLLEGAYRWVFDHPDFRRWQDDAGCRLLWIKGDPGKGKNMLLCGIINELEALPANNCLVYFFCQATDTRLNNATAVLRSLIYMLIGQNPTLAKHIQKEYKRMGAKLFEGPNVWYTLSGVFGAILQDPGLQHVYFLVDALDECQHDLPKLLDLINQHSAAGRVKWIVSSRNRVDVEKDLHILQSNTKLSLELKENAEQVADAVDIYIQHEVTELAKQWNDLSLQDYARSMLQAKAQGTFLWAALVVQELRKADSWDVRMILDEVPAGLNELYDRMMQQIAQLKRDNPKFCRQLLITVSSTYRPLHLAELGLLSGLPSNISKYPKILIKIAKLCGSFLTIRNNIVYFVH
jgi:hypothetical protein